MPRVWCLESGEDMKILIVGGYGMLGSEFPWEIERTPKMMKDFNSIRNFIISRRPDYVINCAGLIGEKKCENAYDTYVANVCLPLFLAQTCNDCNCDLIQFSTFYCGEGNYTMSKRIMEESFEKLGNTIIYLPTLFNEELHIAHYLEQCRLAYTKDVVEWVLDNLGSDDTFLANRGFPTRQDFVEYVGDEYKPIMRGVEAFESTSEIHYMRHWKEAVDEIRG